MTALTPPPLFLSSASRIFLHVCWRSILVLCFLRTVLDTNMISFLRISAVFVFLPISRSYEVGTVCCLRGLAQAITPCRPISPLLLHTLLHDPFTHLRFLRPVQLQGSCPSPSPPISPLIFRSTLITIRVALPYFPPIYIVQTPIRPQFFFLRNFSSEVAIWFLLFNPNSMILS